MILVATPLEASRGILGGGENVDPSSIFVNKDKNIYFLRGGGAFFGRKEIPSPKTVKNVPWTYKKLYFKGELYIISEVSEILCYRQKSLLLHIIGKK